MRRQTRTTLILFGLVVLLGAGVLAQLRREQAPLESVVPQAEASGAQHVALRCADCASRRFELAQGRWWMREPYDLPANAEAVQRLLAIAAAPVRKRLAAEDVDARKLGLDPPQASLQIDALRLDFGLTDALNGDRYVRVGDRVLLVPDRFSAWLFAPPESELDRRLLPPPATIRTLRLDGAERSDLIPAWTVAQASRVAKAAAAGEPAGSPHAIELVDDTGRSLALTLWRTGPDYLVRRRDPDLVYVFDEGAMQGMMAPARR